MKHKEGCVPAGLKLTAILILIVAICVIMFGCSTMKFGCPSEHQKSLDKAARKPFTV